MASFATDSIIIIHTKVRNYKHWKYSYYTIHAGHAKKVELEYLADLQLCARCFIFKLHFSYFLYRHLTGYLHVENNVVFCCIVHHNLFQHIKIIPPHTSCPDKAGSSKQPLIQQIVHASFDPLGGGGGVGGSIFLAIVTSSINILP